jgi:hypothetical protein
MRDSEDIQQLIEQLRILQLQQTDILDRIDVARSSQEYNSAGQRARATAETTSRRERRERNSESRVTTREFIVGDYVIIRNPNPFQADRGIIEKITASRITVKTATGNKIQRAHKNVILSSHE